MWTRRSQCHWKLNGGGRGGGLSSGQSRQVMMAVWWDLVYLARIGHEMSISCFWFQCPTGACIGSGIKWTSEEAHLGRYSHSSRPLAPSFSCTFELWQVWRGLLLTFMKLVLCLYMVLPWSWLSYLQVFRVQFWLTMHFAAVKTIEVSSMQELDRQSRIEKVKKEMEMMKRLDHKWAVHGHTPCVVSVFWELVGSHVLWRVIFHWLSPFFTGT